MNEQELDKEFLLIVKDIITNEDFLKLKEIKHHNESIYDHCIDVGYKAYKLAKLLKLNHIECARAGLLHDFFLYDWRKCGTRGVHHLKKMHAFHHPTVALENALKHFVLTNLEIDIIKKHMFPVTIIPPKYKESWLITMIDKYLAVKEYAIKYKILKLAKNPY